MTPLFPEVESAVVEGYRGATGTKGLSEARERFGEGSGVLKRGSWSPGVFNRASLPGVFNRASLPGGFKGA